MAVRLTGSTQAADLGGGYAVRAPGIRGSVELRHPRSAAERGRSRAAADGTEALERALADTNTTEVRQVEVRLDSVTAGESARSLRAPEGRDAIELRVPDLGAETGQVVLACDENGVLTWHLPLDEGNRVQPPASRGAGGAKRFLIPATQPPAPPPGAGAQRSLLGLVGRKLLKVLVYPVVDPLVGKISELFAERWEERHRPYGLRDFAPDNFRVLGAPALAGADWTRLSAGRALLFIHGTFSTAHGAFSAIPDATFATLHQRYGGRVFALDHFTLSHDPRRNIEWFLSQVPAGVPLDVDIVCHSRGGLVARTLAERPSAFGLDNSRVKVGRVVFVGVPNAGTPLAHPDHMMQMIDRLTSALNLFPTGIVTEVLEGIITAVKVIGHGALQSLDGLAAMRPDGAFLTALNQSGPATAQYFAVAANYEPKDGGLKALVSGRAADAVMDRVFANVPNDLVVPEPGVYEQNGYPAFPIDPARRLVLPPDAGVIHTAMFGHAPVTAKLTEWLTA